MLSKKLLDEILDSQDVYDRHNIYESNFYINNGEFAEKNYIELRSGLKNYIKETINNNLGKKNIEFIM